MVGSVLLDRMVEEGDFKNFSARFFSSSNPGKELTKKLDFSGDKKLFDAFNLTQLSECDIILTCQGSDYTSKVFFNLRKNGWNGYWIDASKTLRMKDDSVIVLDPINKEVIDQAIDNGIKNYIGSNCTVSCMLMAIGALFKADLIEWLSSSTYQAASGGGSKHMRELLYQMGKINHSVKNELLDLQTSILEIDKKVLNEQKSLSKQEVSSFQVPLAGNLIPWIDKDLGNGTSLEEWKGHAETNKIFGKDFLDRKQSVPIDYTCVRVGSMRCHSQSLIIKLKKNISIIEIEQLISSGNDWVKVVPNTKEDSQNNLTPISASGNLNIAIGRLRKLTFGSKYLGAFTIGDQLLWGAAEPLRRILNYISKLH